MVLRYMDIKIFNTCIDTYIDIGTYLIANINVALIYPWTFLMYFKTLSA